MSSSCRHDHTMPQGMRSVCTQCGVVLDDPQLELDPNFDSSAGGRGGRSSFGAARGTTAGSLRNMGSVRPGAIGGEADVAAMHVPRPNTEAARRDMLIAARSLQISDDTVDSAVRIFASAVTSRVVSGTRSVVLLACLYAACRRAHTTHVIYEFADTSGESAHAILSQMKAICEGTGTEVPVIDPKSMIQRLAEGMDLGERTAEVVVCALKVLQAMKDDWIAIGRRPMGVCAAALLVGCYVFNIQRTPEQVCDMARLTANTISKRLLEFSATPAAELPSIDDYQRSNETLPPAFTDSSRLSTEDDMKADQRTLAALYYELIADAKVSAPATPERRAKWREFLTKHGEGLGVPIHPDNLDLERLSSEEQLSVLGLKNTKPIPADVVERSVKREEDSIIKIEEDSQQQLVHGTAYGGAFSGELADGFYAHSNTQEALQGRLDGAAAIHPDYGLLAAQAEGMLHTDPYVMGLDGGEFAMDDDEAAVGGGGGAAPHRAQANTLLTQNTGSFEFDMSFSPQVADPWDAVLAASDAAARVRRNEETDESRIRLEDIMRDKERRHALPWEFLVLQSVKDEDSTDLAKYLVLENEEREQRQAVGKAMYGSSWDRGRARTAQEMQQLEDNRVTKRNRRQLISHSRPLADALADAIRGRGAATVMVSELDNLLGGGVHEDDQDGWE